MLQEPYQKTPEQLIWGKYTSNIHRGTSIQKKDCKIWCAYLGFTPSSCYPVILVHFPR
jgi:hypothetical protein